jgi:hypothetical protein
MRPHSAAATSRVLGSVKISMDAMNAERKQRIREVVENPSWRKVVAVRSMLDLEAAIGFCENPIPVREAGLALTLN